MILKCAMMPQIKETFVRSQPTYKIYILLNTRLCSVVSFLFMKLAFLIGAYFINFRFNVCVLINLINDDKLISLHPDISKIFFRFMSETNSSHKYVQPNIKHICRKN